MGQGCCLTYEAGFNPPLFILITTYDKMNTPQTDKQATDIIGFFSCETVPASFARKLELERNQLRIKNENLIDAKIKAQNAECLMELKVIMMEQDLETIRKIITNGGTAADILKFLDTPPA
jgi:hypothetical protein